MGGRKLLASRHDEARRAFLALFLIVLSVAATAQDPLPLGGIENPPRTGMGALPLGNGRLGAMVVAGTAKERMQWNVDSLWAGSFVDRDRAGATAHLATAREVSFGG
jgi:alpha-L-fucosidase 2